MYSGSINWGGVLSAGVLVMRESYYKGSTLFLENGIVREGERKKRSLNDHLYRFEAYSRHK